MIRRFPIAAATFALSLTTSASMAAEGNQLSQDDEQLKSALAALAMATLQVASVTLTFSADAMFPSGDRIMSRLPEWCDEAAVVHCVQDAEETPSWAEAHRRLQKEGRRSRLSHPSEAQRRFPILASRGQAPEWRSSNVIVLVG